MPSVPHQISRKYREIFQLAPDRLGHPGLDGLYQDLTRRFKTHPFVFIVPLTFGLVLVTYLVVGPFLVKLTDLLQYGF
ncbi:hypothetical protein M1523_02720 [Patescibacteria group bacterium]|nr:hypothetical protein [Patescibacteria group bacterium]MCL5091365.1 hypothetical protein [Patescibacteria group bacterium]